MSGWIYVQEDKQGKTLVRAIKADQVQQVVVEVKQISGKDTRRWSLVFNDGGLYELPDDATVLTRETDPEFLLLLENIAKVLQV
jgi:hypothetical protein